MTQMKAKNVSAGWWASIAFAALMGWDGRVLAEPAASLTVQVDKPGFKISPALYGIFFEDNINHSVDGGIYGELVRNRGFEDTTIEPWMRVEGQSFVTPMGFKEKIWFKDPMEGWTLEKRGDAEASMQLVTENPLTPQTPHSLCWEILKTGGRTAVVNNGYWGVNVVNKATYLLSFYARTVSKEPVNFTVALESENGSKTYATSELFAVRGEWQKYTARMTADGSDPRARLALVAGTTGKVWLDMVSLFPENTYASRPNGNRPDLMNVLKDLKPAFMRFPGGCILEGCALENRYQWKETLGELTRRPGRFSLWGFRGTDGLGFHEYLQMSEDFGSDAMYVVNAGMSCQYRKSQQCTDEAELRTVYIQDALDALEYALGPVTSRWGALRAKNGHPAPFKLKYVEIGNENGGPVYEKNYEIIYKALKEKYPDLVYIADQGFKLPNPNVEVIDEHYYGHGSFFFKSYNKYDSYDRKGPKIYLGEYACMNGGGADGSLWGAISEAAFLTGLERNSDVVIMASFAPLLQNVNNRAWAPDLVLFDSSRVALRSSYYLQKMFAENLADRNLPAQLEIKDIAQPLPGGKIGLGSQLATAEFKELEVTREGKTVFKPDFTDNKSFEIRGGIWQANQGVFSQTDGAQYNALAWAGENSGQDYTLKLKVRALEGKEAVIIAFRRNADDAHEDYLRLFLGVGGTRRHRLELVQNMIPPKNYGDVEGVLQNGQWVDVKVELNGEHVLVSLDGKELFSRDIPVTKVPTVFASSGLLANGGIIIKAVNANAFPVPLAVNLAGAGKVAPSMRVIELASDDPRVENSLQEPNRIVPRESKVPVPGSQFDYRLKPWSITVLRIE